MSDRAIIVVTRIAVGGDDALGDLDPEPRSRAQLAGENGIPSEEYVEERFKILERVSAASLGRVKTRFDWVWLTCPERADQVIENARKLERWPWVVLQGDDYLEDLAYTDKFITVRLDSDDAIRPEAIDDLAEMDLPSNSLVNWWQGYQLDWETGQVGLKHWPYRIQGPFLAVTHDTRENMLDFGGPHTYARGDRTVMNVDGRQFIQTIHGRNQLSKFSPIETQDWERTGQVLSAFGIGAPVNA